MARGTNPDFANTLTMLHADVMHTGKELRDALDKGVEKLEASGQSAQQDTARTVVDELGRMRANLREARDRLSTGADMLNTEVRQAVSQLQAEMRDLRQAVENIAPAARTPLAAAGTPEPAPPYRPAGHDAPGPASDLNTPPGPDPLATATEHDDRPAVSVGATIPAQRDSGDGTSPEAPVVSVDLIRQAVRDAVAEELASLRFLLTEKTDAQGEAAAAVRDDVLVQLRQVAGELRGQLDAVRRGTGAELAALRDEVVALRAGLEQLRPADGGTVAVEVSTEHSELLRQAARVSSADLLCHRDVWEFLTAHAGRHRHFRVPPQVAGEGQERIRAAVSGRSLIALLISLHSVGHTAGDGDGDQELAATLYERIRSSLTGLSPHGRPVTITLDDRAWDDRSAPADDAAPDDVQAPLAGSAEAGGDQEEERRAEPPDGRTGGDEIP
ncbi:hypothetical protein [Streptomyces sp. NPDC048644]|uniref:hypothetical protein n=1 Tax=Streptomyces sp. NPDC048644 TaxID=3365582 RepID=UPI00371956A7